MIHVEPALPARSLSTHPRRAPRPDAPRLARLERLETELACGLRQVLERKALRLAVVSRVGSDLSRLRFEGDLPYYTHAGLALREGDAWRVHHLVNTHEGPRGHLYRQTLAEFLQDDPFAYRVSVVIPRPRLQEAIADILGSLERQALYEPAYSRIAYPYSTRYQNSNQWVTELIGAARSGEGTRSAVQAFLRAEGALRPDVLRVGSIPVQIGAALLTRNTGFNDHPIADRLRGRFAFLLPNAIRAYLAVTDETIADETVELPADSTLDLLAPAR